MPDTAALLAAIRDTPPGGWLEIPEGEHNISAPLERCRTHLYVDDGSIHIYGKGKRTIIRQHANEDVFSFTCAPGAQVAGWSLRNLLITYAPDATDGCALRTRHWHRGRVEDLYVNGAPYAGLKIEQCILNRYDGYYCMPGFDIGGPIAPRPQFSIHVDDYDGLASNGHTFTGGESTRNDVGVLLAGSGRGNVFLNHAIQECRVGFIAEPNHIDYTYTGWLENNQTQYILHNGQGFFRPNGDAAVRMICDYELKARSIAPQTIPHGETRLVTFPQTEWNVGASGDMRVDDERFEIQVPGKYQILVTIPWDDAPLGKRSTTILRNGAINVEEVEACGVTRQQVIAEERFARGDTISVGATHWAGQPLAILGKATIAIRWLSNSART